MLAVELDQIDFFFINLFNGYVKHADDGNDLTKVDADLVIDIRL